jgi:hypothetical protein
VRTQRCRITFYGVLDDADREAFGDFDIETTDGCTVLIGEVDQPTLDGLQNRLGALDLWIVSLNQAETQGQLATRVATDRMPNNCLQGRSACWCRLQVSCSGPVSSSSWCRSMSVVSPCFWHDYGTRYLSFPVALDSSSPWCSRSPPIDLTSLPDRWVLSRAGFP